MSSFPSLHPFQPESGRSTYTRHCDPTLHTSFLLNFILCPEVPTRGLFLASLSNDDKFQTANLTTETDLLLPTAANKSNALRDDFSIASHRDPA